MAEDDGLIRPPERLPRTRSPESFRQDEEGLVRPVEPPERPTDEDGLVRPSTELMSATWAGPFVGLYRGREIQQGAPVQITPQSGESTWFR